MRENIDNIQKSILNFVANYEDEKSGRIDPHERMLRYLEAPYERMPEHDRVVALLKQKLTEADVEVWFAFPDFDYRIQPVLVEEMIAKTAPQDPNAFRSSAQKLIDQGYLVQAPRGDGQLGYMRTYMLYVAIQAVMTNDHDPLTDAFIDWWLHCLHDGGKLRSVHPEHRVIPHQDSLPGAGGKIHMPDAGEKIHMADAGGKIPMNLQIPDTRQVVPTDYADAVLRGVDTMAVINCVCRAATEARGERECDYPIEEVCFLFNEAAQEAIKVGYGRQISNEEGVELMHRLRDMGLVQVISNSLRPLSMCNCCGCCCLCLSSIARHETNLAVPSRFLAEVVAPDRCVGCGKCSEFCQMSAVHFGDAGVQIDFSQCIGCGQCAARCPAGVIRMDVKAGAADRPSIDKLNRIYL